MTFAWPCLLTKNCVNPLTKYHGHLLLSHIIAKFAIHKRIVLQVRTNVYQRVPTAAVLVPTRPYRRGFDTNSSPSQ